MDRRNMRKGKSEVEKRQKQGNGTDGRETGRRDRWKETVKGMRRQVKGMG